MWVNKPKGRWRNPRHKPPSLFDEIIAHPALCPLAAAIVAVCLFAISVKIMGIQT